MTTIRLELKTYRIATNAPYRAMTRDITQRQWDMITMILDTPPKDRSSIGNNPRDVSNEQTGLDKV